VQHGGKGAGGVVVHHQPVRPAVLEHVVHGGHVGVPHPGGDAGLGQAVRVRRGELLGGDVPVQQFVPGPPHARRAAAAHPLGQPVPAGQQHTGDRMVSLGAGLRSHPRRAAMRPDRRALATRDHDKLPSGRWIGSVSTVPAAAAAHDTHSCD